MKNKIILVVVVALVFLAFIYVFFNKNQDIFQKKSEITAKTLKIGEITLNIEVVDTDNERARGLSGRQALKNDEGMLFVFDKEGYYGIWMKDMNFPIDIAWLDKNKKIIHLEENVLPESYPKIFNSRAQSLFVLETQAGFFRSAGVKLGDIAEF